MCIQGLPKLPSLHKHIFEPPSASQNGLMTCFCKSVPSSRSLHLFLAFWKSLHLFSLRGLKMSPHMLPLHLRSWESNIMGLSHYCVCHGNLGVRLPSRNEAKWIEQNETGCKTTNWTSRQSPPFKNSALWKKNTKTSFSQSTFFEKKSSKQKPRGHWAFVTCGQNRT